MTIIRTAFPWIAVALVAVPIAAATRPITLAIKTEKAVAPPASAARAGPMRLTLRDAREGADSPIVGAQRERGKDLYQWRSVQPVGPAVEGLVRRQLGVWGAQISPDADLEMALALTRYWVTEKSETFGSTYIAEVTFKVTVSDRSGREIASAEVPGGAKRSGVDGRATSCNEVLTLALQGALDEALSVFATAKVPVEAPATVPMPDGPPPVVVDAAKLLEELLLLKSGGMADDVLVSYVRQRRLTAPLTVDDILLWKDKGIPDEAIKAAVER